MLTGVDLLDGQQFSGMVGVDPCSSAPVLAGEPVVGEVQVDPGRLDRGVPGLGLDRFELHPGLAEAGETGVAELMAGGAVQSGALARGARRIVSIPSAVSGRPRVGPLSATNTRSVSVSRSRSPRR